MRFYFSLLTILFILFIPACSGGKSDPVLPNSDIDASVQQDEGVFTGEASDVLYVSRSSDTVAYKAFGMYNVTIDPVALTGEIIPARTASGVGTTFDADLTQFLTIAPCPNCLQIANIGLTASGQVSVGFAIKHPFADPAKRPDLHGFDVRGIVLADGNFNFPNTLVNLTDTVTAPARANLTLLANPDGFTHHFDELAEDVHYFDPPRGYDANINPYRRYFVNATTGLFNYNNPSGYNVIPCGSAWETQSFIFNVAPSQTTLDFGFVVDCAYGASATLATRFTPSYYLPEFNRKEAWKVVSSIESNDMMSGVSTSTAAIKVQVYDWQAGKVADPNYPDPTNKSGLSAKSDVASVTLEIPSVTALTTVTSASSGNGTGGSPYIYNLTAINTLGAPAGDYYCIIAVRDDLQGQKGPLGIPETPKGFPFAGPEIYDYSNYNIFAIRVNGTPPDITAIPAPTNVYQGDTISLNATVVEIDGDPVEYLWQQVSPATPLGTFVDPTVEDPQFNVPSMYDIPPAGVGFILQLTASDIDGNDTRTVNFIAYEVNTAPVCDGIDTIPEAGIINSSETMDFHANAYDPEDHPLLFGWNMNFNPAEPFPTYTDATGQDVADYSWADQGFYIVSCRVLEDRTYALLTTCRRTIVQEGIINDDLKIDNDTMTPLPSNSYPGSAVTSDRNGNVNFHAIYNDLSTGAVIYCNNLADPNTFSGHVELAPELAAGFTTSTRLASRGVVLAAMWLETVPDGLVNQTSVKVMTSSNNGVDWNPEVAVAKVTEPILITDADICAGSSNGEFYVFFMKRDAGNNSCLVIGTTDFGETWSLPGTPSNGQFRDSVASQTISNPMIKMSSNDVLHAVWLDSIGGTAQYYYDYSTDQGATWNTDMLMTSGTPSWADMAVDMSGNVYLAYSTGSSFELLNIVYGTPPTLGSPDTIYSTSYTDHGVSLYVSPDGEAVVAVLAYQATDYIQRYYYNYNDGSGWQYFEHNFGSTHVDWPSCAGIMYNDPARFKIFNTWIDYRTSISPNAHIFGEFVYLAERP